MEINQKKNRIRIKIKNTETKIQLIKSTHRKTISKKKTKPGQNKTNKQKNY